MPAELLFTPDLSVKPIVTMFYESTSGTLSYVIQDVNSNSCAVIDCVLDFDYAAGRTSYESADQIINFIEQAKLTLEWIIETHVHADHLSAAPYIKAKLGGKIGISEQIEQVQKSFADVFEHGQAVPCSGSQFDYLFTHGEHYKIGSLDAYAISTPGHTPACMTHVIGDSAFVGDTLFMPDSGTARVDFPGGDAKTLFASIQLILSLPSETRMFVCHDYQPNGRELSWQTSVAQQRNENIHVKQGITEQAYVQMRTARDATLSMPRLIIPSLQVNMQAGNLPEESDKNGTVYLKVPINRL